MEGALKMMRSHGSHISPEKYEIISLENSFHGRTMGALSITGQHKYRKDFEPLLPGVKFIHANDVTGAGTGRNERTAGIVLEVIQGEGGIYPLSARVRPPRAENWPTASTRCWCSMRFNAAWAGRAHTSDTSYSIR